MISKNMNSTGSNREWALETLLKEEKVNVQNLEQKNKVLIERIQNLENMLKSSCASNLSETNAFSKNEISNLSESNSLIISKQYQMIQSNDPHKDFL